MFNTPGRFYKGNLHCHSTQSDGALPPEEVCRLYAERGYDFIALTDHFVGAYSYPVTDTHRYRTNRFTTILGAELHSGAMANGELWHLLAVGLPTDFTPSNSPGFEPIADQESGADLARRARDAGAFVAIAHPHWSALTEADARSIDAAHAVEVYNHGCHVDSDRGYGMQTLDLLLNEGRRLTLCATDDSHFKTDDAFGGWVMVKAEANEPNALLAALRAGHYYASQGPDYQDITFGDAGVTVRSTPAAAVIVQGQGSATNVVRGESMTETMVPFGRTADSPWLRVSIVDADGKRAWSQPYWKTPDAYAFAETDT